MKKKTISPTQRSLAKLKKDGWLVAITERWNPFAFIRQDLWGFCDLLAIKGINILAIQTTSSGNIQERINKIKANPNFEKIKRAGIKVEVWGWGKKGARGKRKLWECRIIKL